MSIKKRDVFFDRTGGFIRFWDWALVTTTIGTMAEPFSVDLRHAPQTKIQNFDATNCISRIDNMSEVDIGKQQITLSGDGSHLHGGYMFPRTGR